MLQGCWSQHIVTRVVSTTWVVSNNLSATWENIIITTCWQRLLWTHLVDNWDFYTCVMFYNYDRFLNTHGSHVITAVTFGASIDQYAFAEQSSSYTARDFTVKACASLAKNVPVASISVSACFGVTREEINQVLYAFVLCYLPLHKLLLHLWLVYCAI